MINALEVCDQQVAYAASEFFSSIIAIAT